MLLSIQLTATVLVHHKWHLLPFVN